MKRAAPPTPPAAPAAEAPAPRDFNEELALRCLAGHESLGRILVHFMRQQEPVPRRIAQAFEIVLFQYEHGEIDDLAKALGVFIPTKLRKDGVHRKANRQYRVRHVVARYHYLHGCTLNDPSYHEGTAFEAAAAELGLAPSTVFDIYRGKR